jgi:hypothetical protein
MGDLLLDAWRRRDSVDLTLVAWLAVPVVVTPYLQLPSKFLLAAAPAAALAVTRALARVPAARARVTLIATVVAGTILGHLILRADAEFAGLGRQAVAQLIPTSGAMSRRVWFDGHWGFQWYAEKAGARPLSLTGPYPDDGDLVVISGMTSMGILDGYPNRRLLQTVSAIRHRGLLMSRTAGAGFYTNQFGLLPWAWGHEPEDRYDLWLLDPASTP